MRRGKRHLCAGGTLPTCGSEEPRNSLSLMRVPEMSFREAAAPPPPWEESELAKNKESEADVREER